MLALGRALAAAPEVLLVDELSLGLAPGVVGRLFEAVQASARAGTAVVIVEQYTGRALEIADEVYVLNRGRHVLQARAQELVMDPDRLRAAYLGAPARSGVRGRQSTEGTKALHTSPR
jgi:branched-chain amino acid transport system ATP-binding protein